MTTEIISNEIEKAVSILKNGGLVAVPTETVYGLAGNGLDEAAVKSIYEVKGRPEIKALSLMVDGADSIERYCKDVPQQAYWLAEKFWPGPLTIILRSKEIIPPIVRAGGETVGLRCPDHPMTLRLLRAANIPLAAPSANPSGKPSPKNAAQVAEYFDGRIDGIIDGGQCGIGLESTIIDLSCVPYRILRQGALPEQEIWQALADKIITIGITGGTGCGKTTALRVLRDMGALVIDCDELYHELTCSSAEMRAELCARFGDIYDGDVLARKRLGAIVFSDKKALAELNSITHKYVDEEIARRLTEHAKNGGMLAAIDAIGLLENSFGRRTAFNVAVCAPTEERVRRLILREGISEDYARLRISAQKDNEYFAGGCDHTLFNDGSQKDFEDKCKKFFTEEIENVRQQRTETKSFL